MFLPMLPARQDWWLLSRRLAGDSPVVWPLVIPWILVAAVLVGRWTSRHLAATEGCGVRDGV